MEYLLLLIQIVLQTQWQISTLHLLSNRSESNSLQMLFFFLQTDYITIFDHRFVSLHSKNGYFVLCGCCPDLYQ